MGSGVGELVKFEIRDNVAIVTLNRPEKLNAINDEMMGEMREAMDLALNGEDSRVVLIRGEGRAFTTGRDTSQLGHRAGGDSDFHFVHKSQKRAYAQMDCPKPIIAAINGWAVGGGFELALACDVRIAADDALMMVPEINYGLLTDMGGSQLLSMLVGPSRAKLMLLTGRKITAQQAELWGAVDLVVPRERLDEEAFAIAKDMASRPPINLAMGKQLINHIWLGKVREGIGLELLAQTALFRTDDYAEARSAQREGRAPEFQGR